MLFKIPFDQESKPTETNIHLSIARLCWGCMYRNLCAQHPKRSSLLHWINPEIYNYNTEIYK